MAITDQASALERTVFSMDGTQLLKAGSTMKVLANAPCLWAHIKVYAEGGENALHVHPHEDHLFFVVAGEATFIDADANETVVGAYQGMMMPRGNAYAFHSTGESNLVMLRVGSPTDTTLFDPLSPPATAPGMVIPSPIADRMNVDGSAAPGGHELNKDGAIPGVPAEGEFLRPPSI